MKYWITALVAFAALGLAGCGTEMNLKAVQVDGMTATPTPGTGTPDGKVGICHRTGSATNPWVYIIVDANAIPAHQKHGDVFGLTSQAECDALSLTGTPPPLSATATETALETETATPTPTASDATETPMPGINGKVGICHRTGSATNPYVFIVVSKNAVQAHRKHGDIIGVSSAAACPKTLSNNNNNGNNQGNGKGNGKGKDKEQENQNDQGEQKD